MLMSICAAKNTIELILVESFIVSCHNIVHCNARSFEKKSYDFSSSETNFVDEILCELQGQHVPFSSYSTTPKAISSVIHVLVCLERVQ